ncbi:SPOR domain-containing protein [Alteromonas sp. ASW11-36]|uniref:SPOR domain-containing protein n=1 Tax=Alteromonas arenosi TaxID=3055817 RepID=A0ABT7SYR4_9ALTE|nr:SPOR domain-containing protein [Alteromonas sp. ASW11-36]MDM7861320.1 SPOR domain-containing protein [Alteromonas sp. ASW11-36]
MTQRDYVKRGRATKQTKKVEKPAFPWVNVTVALLIIVGFIFLLWKIKDNAPDPEVAEDLPEVVATEPEKELPELPEEEWEFIRTLPGYEVEIEQTEEVQSTRRYIMQCGSFRSEEQAEEMRAQIAMTGLESVVRPSEGSNGRWYRVMLGPYDSKRAAERNRHTIRDVGIRTCQIWYWNQ